jgi:cysteine-rich repeat protein
MKAMRAVLVVVAIAGCYGDPVRHCPTVDCPQDMVCDNRNGCALKEQVEQCAGQADGTVCSYPGVANGECKDELCLPSGCGNGIETSGEVCDDGNTMNGDMCSADCRSLEECGNGILDPAAGETCDCGTPGTPGTSPACNGLPNSNDDTNSPCRGNCQLRRCGDGNLDGLEQCEGTNLAGKACTDLGFYSGTLACSEFCTFDTTSCAGTCGDGELDADEDEQCDGDQFGALTCQAFGFQTGFLTCNAGCAVDTSGCDGRCGDGIKNGTEQCDGSDLGDPATVCTDVGFYGGELACTASCSFDTSSCEGSCGDLDKNGPEQCDGPDLDNASCVTAGFYGGDLACNPICGFDTSECEGRCGDGLLNGPEQCDKTALAGKSCTDFGFQGGQLACNATCGFDTSSCVGFCGDGSIGGSEQCDTNNFGGLSCAAFGFYTGELSCTIGCTVFAGACDEFCGDGDKNGPEPCDPGRGEELPPDFGTTTCANIDPEKFVGTGLLTCDPRCESIDTKGCAQLNDGKCDDALGETCFNSLADCRGGEVFCCGNGVCAPVENLDNCAADCAK